MVSIMRMCVHIPYEHFFEYTVNVMQLDILESHYIDYLVNITQFDVLEGHYS